MKTKKLSFCKRIFICLCCTVLLSSSIFISYSMTVYAADDYDLKDCAEDIIGIALLIGNICMIPASGGLTALSALAIAQGLLQGSDSVVNIYNYVTDNGDGTYTISPEFVQAVMDAAEQLEEQGFSDSHVTAQGEGNLYIYKWTVSESFMYNHPYNTVPESHHVTRNISAEKNVRVAGLRETKTSQDSNGRTVTMHEWTVYNYDRNYTNLIIKGGRGRLVETCDGRVVSEYSNYSDSGFGVLNLRDGTEKSDYYNGSLSFGGNFPIFSSIDAVKTYLETGKGYKDAENYRPTPIFRRHSSYTPTYSGGSVTVNRTVIENITQKITEVDADDSLTDDQKIEKLQEYIRTGGTGDTGGGGGTGGGSGNTDYDDNKDLPAGTDLTDTNSWLKKIYLKVCQIYDKMNSAVEGAEQTALTKIQESLDEIIVQLKKIKRWTAIDTVVDGVDAIADWLDLIRGVLKDAKEGAGSAVSAIASGVGDSVDLMAKKFPFSIPWDILFFVSALSAEPQVPYFEIPFNIELSALDITIDYTMELDFSQLQWLSDLSRLLLSMTYAVGLMKLTFGVTSVGKEE